MTVNVNMEYLMQAVFLTWMLGASVPIAIGMLFDKDLLIGTGVAVLFFGILLALVGGVIYFWMRAFS